MRWVLLSAVGILGWIGVNGCGPNMTETPAERDHKIRRLADIEAREFNDDVELFLQLDRPSRLSKWHVE